MTPSLEATYEATAAGTQRESGLDNPSNWVPVLEKPVYKPRKLRVVCVGAGYSGLMMAYKYKHQLEMKEHMDLVIYEKNSDIGGTWLENRYPGVACDVGATQQIKTGSCQLTYHPGSSSHLHLPLRTESRLDQLLCRGPRNLGVHQEDYGQIST